MGAISVHIFTIDGDHGILPLPKNTLTALDRISSEIGLLKIPCVPWHLDRAKGWARAQGCPGPVPGPARQPWARPKCQGPHDIFISPVSEQIRFRADMVLLGSERMPWAPSMSRIRILMAPMPFFCCRGHGNDLWSNPGVNRNTC